MAANTRVPTIWVRGTILWCLSSILQLSATACRVHSSFNVCSSRESLDLEHLGTQTALLGNDTNEIDLDDLYTVYDVKPSKNKGLGVFAKHDLKRGTVIIIEEPLVAVPLPEMVQGQGFKILDMITSLETAYSNLSPISQKSFTDLHDVRFPSEEDQNKLLTIFRSNAYNTCDSKVGLFPKIARINHSCTPNSGNEWVDEAGHRIIYASRDIKEGKEITVSYIPLIKKTADRQSRLAQYGFTCDCSACQSSHGDKRRTKIADLLETLEMKVNTAPSKKLEIRKKQSTKALNLLSLVEEEGLNDYLSRAQHLSAVFSQRLGDIFYLFYFIAI
ncbi:hypothetical protein HYALB_00002253 [Hymenoscyphus albidus]|uniref:SET domain-containing protein n=1 Tax=Hymenoscyphus albidus TaxID=595503 RepID=A0A9N9LJH8_9HELO|nr:hypothetical protein HYALB_00002253 [Hymenoscyphus albidus]